MRKTSVILLSGTLVASLTACAAPSAATWVPPTPPPADSKVSALIPKGSYEVSGALVLQGEPTYALDGYVDFGSASDGIECAADYEVANLRTNTAAKITVSRTVRAPGGPSWSADVSDHDPSISKIPIKWRDTSDPAAPALPMLFAPSVIASDLSPGVVKGAGTDHLCSIGVMPRFMRLDDKQPSSGTRLAFDETRSEQTTLAARGRWVEGYLTAAGLTGKKYDQAAEIYYEMSKVSFKTIIKDTVVDIRELNNGAFEIVQIRKGKPMITLTFTPTSTRTILEPSAQTYFELVSLDAATLDSETILNSFPDQASLSD